MTVSEDTMTQSSISISKPFILGKLSYQSLSNKHISIWYIQNIQILPPPPKSIPIFFKKCTFPHKKKTYLTGCSNTIHILLINESRLATLERFKKSTCEEAKVETLRWPGGRCRYDQWKSWGCLNKQQKNVPNKSDYISDWKKGGTPNLTKLYTHVPIPAGFWTY